MEQPTLFYAAVGILALAGQSGGINTTLAWSYARSGACLPFAEINPRTKINPGV